MNRLISVEGKEPWKRRLTLPAYQVTDAARYAHVSPQTVLNWQVGRPGANKVLGKRERGMPLSYLQLVEVAFVATLRKMGIKLADIRNARDYIAQQLNAEFPFALHKFKTDGQDILMTLDQFDKRATRKKLVKVNKGGQLAWSEILERKFQEFDYLGQLAVRWKVGGPSSSVQIDPRISFGAPTISGVPTWAIAGRWESGESLDDIADDFSLKSEQIRDALKFEGASGSWTH